MDNLSCFLIDTTVLLRSYKYNNKYMEDLKRQKELEQVITGDYDDYSEGTN